MLDNLKVRQAALRARSVELVKLVGEGRADAQRRATDAAVLRQELTCCRDAAAQARIDAKVFMSREKGGEGGGGGERLMICFINLGV